VAALRDPDTQVRSFAAEGLGWPDNESGVAPLVGAVDDRDWQVVDAALAALAEIGRPAIPALVSLFTHGDILKAYHASRALAKMGSPAVGTLIAELSSPSEDSRKWAAITLGQIGDKEAVAPLKKMLSSPSEGEQYVATEALRHMGVEVRSES
jgi:HEAT repeat protein